MKARIACALLALAACRSPINEKTYDHYMDAGSRAEALGDLQGAEEAYRRAYVNTELGHLPDELAATSLQGLARVKRKLGKDAEAAGAVGQAEQLCETAVRDASQAGVDPGERARITYNCGLVKRDACKLDDAEALLRETLEIQTRTGAGTRAELSGRTCELAHLGFERGRFQDALPSFERCMELLREFDVERTYPDQYLYLLGEYAQVLRATDRRADADAIEAAAVSLRERGISPRSAWQHTRCSG